MLIYSRPNKQKEQPYFAALGLRKLSERILWSVSAMGTAIMLSACSTISAGVESISASITESDWYNSSFWDDYDSKVQACITGGLIGGLSCVFIIDPVSKASCVAAAAGSCASMVGVDVLLDKVQSHYAEKEDQLNALAEQMEKYHSESIEAYEAAQKEYGKNTKTLSRLLLNIDKKRVKKNRLAKHIAAYDKKIEELEKEITVQEARVSSYRLLKEKIVGYKILDFTDEEVLANYDREIELLNSSINEMRSVLENYTEDRNVLNLVLTENYSAKTAEYMITSKS
ncbi:MAG: hypothetical protein SOV16_04050 [Anaerobiospirillum succiniciproducens]|uniref:hypothetical protein n=1 Tax=Anaerobiospirillum succiniciproducens TaxID=13335 RepID=UPI002A759F98|nr:hypothetical protein [Anaerobiospirillum succiniciproducens]MDY2798333.1 hypothetical protein [Anaerobiospirillum succiniciproducens]